MLICNYSYINRICGHNHSGVTNPVWIIRPHTMRGYYGKAQTESTSDQTRRDGFPTGTNPPYSYILGDKGALLSSTTTTNGVGTFTSNLSQGINIEASLSGLGEITAANLALVVSLASSISGSSTITTANLVGIISLAASLTTTGSLTAGLNVVAFMNAALSGSGTLAADLKGTLSMEATIYVNQSEATVQQLVEGVWNALTADFNAAGTMGEAMGAAGTAGDPWTTSLPGAYGSGSAGHIIGNLLSNIPASVWDELKTTHSTDDTYGKIVQDLETLARQIKALTAAQL